MSNGGLTNAECSPSKLEYTRQRSCALEISQQNIPRGLK